MIGSPRVHHRSIDSTNRLARELAGAGAEHGTVVTADEQTAGRGRQGRTWTAPASKALLYSALLRPLDPVRHATLPLAVPLAVCEAAETLRPGIECGVKWPNDVHLEGRKLSGVLIEARPRDGWAVIGVGLNLTIAEDEFPPELRETATSIGTSHPAAAATALSERLDRWVDADADQVLAAWRQRDVLRGKEVAWEDGAGIAEGIDERGYLLVRTADGDLLALGAGEVHLTRV